MALDNVLKITIVYLRIVLQVYILKLMNSAAKQNMNIADKLGPTTATAASQLQLAFAIHSEIMLEQWYQQLPAIIRRSMIKDVTICLQSLSCKFI